MIKAEIVAHSLSPQGDELISVLATFPRIILAEVNTHRMLSKNTASSRAVPPKKMLQSIEENPFIPIAWQKSHTGMQGTEYITSAEEIQKEVDFWLKDRDYAVQSAKDRLERGVTKQIVNRGVENYMWVTALLTGPREGWDNFFNLRCPDYIFHEGFDQYHFNSRKDVIKKFGENESVEYDFGDVLLKDLSELQWLQLNFGQAEIHMMALAESIWDAVNESIPEQLQPGDWHIPFKKQISLSELFNNPPENPCNVSFTTYEGVTPTPVKISVAMSARTSYTVVGDELKVDYSNLVGLHDRLLSQNPPHSSPMEHCARAMDDNEYNMNVKGNTGNFNGNSSIIPIAVKGWCRNFKGFIPYRHIVETT